MIVDALGGSAFFQSAACIALILLSLLAHELISQLLPSQPIL